MPRRAPQSFPRDSGLVDIVRPGRGFSRGKLIPRGDRPSAVVIHTTGIGPVRRFRDKKQRARHGWKTSFDAANHIYARLMDPSAHYVVGQKGQVAQTVPESHCAWHVGGRKANLYWRANWAAKAVLWWRERFPLLDSPRDLAHGQLWAPYEEPPGLLKRIRYPRSWARGSANANTIGIEVVPPLYGATVRWSEACWDSLVALVLDICDRHGIEPSMVTVITHSDAHPLARSRRGEPWDVGPNQWSFEEFARRARLEAT